MMNLNNINFTAPNDIRIPDLVEEPKFEDSELTITEKITRILNYQFKNNINDSIIRGFLFHGIPGTGKTTIAKKIAKELGSWLIFVDGAGIAKAKYGDSEQAIKDIFSLARQKNSEKGSKKNGSIILFDDVESLFMSRDAMGLVREWHFSQNSVFFHEVDELDTSKTAIILTTNRYDLIDDAIKDRFYNIKFPNPTLDTLIEIMRKNATKHAMHTNKISDMEIYMRTNPEKFKSIRDVLRLVTKEFVDSIVL